MVIGDYRQASKKLFIFTIFTILTIFNSLESRVLHLLATKSVCGKKINPITMAIITILNLGLNTINVTNTAKTENINVEGIY